MATTQAYPRVTTGRKWHSHLAIFMSLCHEYFMVACAPLIVTVPVDGQIATVISPASDRIGVGDFQRRDPGFQRGEPGFHAWPALRFGGFLAGAGVGGEFLDRLQFLAADQIEALDQVVEAGAHAPASASSRRPARAEIAPPATPAMSSKNRGRSAHGVMLLL